MARLVVEGFPADLFLARKARTARENTTVKALVFQVGEKPIRKAGAR